MSRVQKRHKKGNPNWGKGMPLAQLYGEQNVSEFDKLVQKLKLLPDQYEHSTALRAWVKRNHRNHFVPEWLLLLWEIEIPVDDDPVGSGALALGGPR